jgi:tRNA (guanine37-N1)-methyltransferase
MFKFQIITIFPERYEVYFSTGLPKKAIEKKIIDYKIVNLLDFAIIKNKKKIIDDKPYGGGPGMVLRIEPIHRALESLKEKFPVIAMTPSGVTLNQKVLNKMYDTLMQNHIMGLTFISGYYEGFDQRILDYLVDYEISLGDFILNSGDLAILCFIDAFCRLIPNFLGKEESLKDESFNLVYNEEYLIEYPQYTKPREYNGWKVPEILLSGNHKLIEKWRYEKSLDRTKKRKKDILDKEIK